MKISDEKCIPMLWFEMYDDDHNTYFEGNTPYHTSKGIMFLK